MTGPMPELMESCPVPIDRFEIGRWRWNLHEIASRVVVGTCRVAKVTLEPLRSVARAIPRPEISITPKSSGGLVTYRIT